MLQQGVKKLPKNAKPIRHSDQGWNTKCGAMESFFERIKTECFYGKSFENINELERTIHRYIHYYNKERIQLKLKGLSPIQYRTQSLK